jgi:hypothetical protein
MKRAHRQMGSRTHLAYHEAGQFVIALRVECGAWHCVSIEPDEAGCLDQIVRELEPTERVAQQIMAICAGRAAQVRFDPAYTVEDDESVGDEDEIRHLARRLQGVTLDELRARATELVAEHWADIALIADELLRYGTVDEGVAQIVIDASHGIGDAAYWLLLIRHPAAVEGGDA